MQHNKYLQVIEEHLEESLSAEESMYQSKLEPFKHYKERMKQKGLQEFSDYVNHIQHGYELIMSRIEEVINR